MIKKCYLLSVLILTLFSDVAAQNARVQIIHNSPDPDVVVMDLYVNDELVSAGFSYHEATAFFTVAVDFSIGLALPGSAGPQDILMSYPFTLLQDSKNIFVINGVTNPIYQPFEPLSVYQLNTASEVATNPSGTTFTFFNGATDIGTVDLLETELIQLPAFDDVGYGDFTEYLELFTADYELSVFNASADFSYASYAAPFSAYGWAGEAVTVVSSGFINQANNPGGLPVSLWATTASGGLMTELPLNELNLFASVQFIQNSADVDLTSLDILVNGQLLVDDIQFRHATSFIPVPAAQPVTIEVLMNDGSSLPVPFSLITGLASGEEYLMVVAGQMTAQDYNPYVPLHMMVLENAKSSSGNPDEVAVCLVHAATDAGNIDLNDITSGNEVIVNNLNYGEFSTYGNFTTAQYELSLTDETGSLQIGSYVANFTDAGGAAFAIIASGFLNVNANSGGADFGLWLADANGGAMTELPGIPESPVFAYVQWMHTSSDPLLANIDVYVNGEFAINSFSYAEASGFLEVQVNEPVLVEIYPAGTTGADNLLLSQQIALTENGFYHASLAGIISDSGYNPAPPAQWVIMDEAIIESTVPTSTDIRYLHTATDAGDIDLNELTLTINPITGNLGYEEFTGYQSFDTSGDVGIAVLQAGGSFQFGQWLLPLQSAQMAGEAAVIFTGGFLNVANNSNGNAFQLYLVRNNGVVLPLEIYTGMDDLILPEGFNVYPNPANDLVRVQIDDFTKTGICELTITGITGNVLHRQKLNSSAFELVDVSALPEGVYTLQVAGMQQRLCTKLIVVH